MQETTEDLILRNLFFNKTFSGKVFPFLREDYFSNPGHKEIFLAFQKIANDFHTTPTLDAVYLEVKGKKGITEEAMQQVKTSLKEYQVEKNAVQPEDWLLKTTEKFCQEKHIFNAVLRSVKILDNQDKELKKEAIPSLLTEALAVNFDDRVGHDYFANIQERYEFYHKKEKKFPLDIDYFNKITDGGLVSKTLNCFLAPPKAGKTTVMCHMASHFLREGKNVLYITLEMSEERIAQRIDANLMNVDMKDVKDMIQTQYSSKLTDLRRKTLGNLVIKEYPTSTAGTAHFRHLINELNLKKGFKPEVIFVDYINICTSTRYKAGVVNSYTLIKGIAEELRGLAVEFDLPVITATQSIRSAWSKSDLNMEDVSESAGLPATVDLFVGIIRSEELDQMNCLMFKQLANRYNDSSYYRKFLVGIERSKMKLMNVEQDALGQLSGTEEEAAQTATVKEDTPVFDKSGFGQRNKEFGKDHWKT